MISSISFFPSTWNPVSENYVDVVKFFSGKQATEDFLESQPLIKEAMRFYPWILKQSPFNFYFSGKWLELLQLAHGVSDSGGSHHPTQLSFPGKNGRLMSALRKTIF